MLRFVEGSRGSLCGECFVKVLSRLDQGGHGFSARFVRGSVEEGRDVFLEVVK